MSWRGEGARSDRWMGAVCWEQAGRVGGPGVSGRAGSRRLFGASITVAGLAASVEAFREALPVSEALEGPVQRSPSQRRQDSAELKA
jgi:hypothetical protein